MIRFVTIAEIVAAHVSHRDLSAEYAANLGRRAAKFASFAGDDSPCAFTHDAINSFLSAVEPAVRRATLKSIRGELITIWRAASAAGLCEMPDTRKIQTRRVPWEPPDCYQVDDVRAMLAAAATLPGTMADRTPRSDYWSAVIRVAWGTGLRRSDIVRVDCHRLRGSLLSTVSSKSGQLTVHELSDSAVDCLRRLDRRRPTMHWPHRWKSWQHWWDRILADAGIKHGCFKWLRRSSGSYVEKLYPGMGARHLGHTSVATFQRHYDARMVAEPGTLPRVPEV